MSAPSHQFVAVGVDGSPAGERALYWAAAEASGLGARLVIVHAYSPVVGWEASGVATSTDLVELTRDLAKGVLDRADWLARQAHPTLVVKSELVFGSPVSALREISADAVMTVVGSRGTGGFAAALGSVATKVAEHAEGPVVVVPDPAKTAHLAVNGPVIVGVDGSPNSLSALEFAFAAADRRRVQLHVVRSWDDAGLEQIALRVPVAIHAETMDQQEGALLAEEVAGWREKYPDVMVHHIVRRGRPARALSGICTQMAPSLLVVGTHGRGALVGLVLGSTSRELLSRMPCPIAVVRPHQ